MGDGIEGNKEVERLLEGGGSEQEGGKDSLEQLVPVARPDFPACLDPPWGFVIGRLCWGWGVFPFPRDGLTCYMGPDVTWVGIPWQGSLERGLHLTKGKKMKCKVLLSYLAKKRFQSELWS